MLSVYVTLWSLARGQSLKSAILPDFSSDIKLYSEGQLNLMKAHSVRYNASTNDTRSGFSMGSLMDLHEIQIVL